MQSFIEECTRAYSFEGFAIRGYLIFAGSSHELYYIIDMYSLIYYAVPYTYIPLDSFAAQEINRRARATSNDRLCTRWMYASQIHICITRIYTYTHWCMFKRDRSWYLFQLSVSCLPSPGYPTARVFQPKIHHVHTVSTALIPTRPVQSRCPVRGPRRSNPLIGLLKHPCDLYDDSRLILASLRSNYTHVAIVWQLSRSYVENFRDKLNIKPSRY